MSKNQNQTPPTSDTPAAEAPSKPRKKRGPNKNKAPEVAIHVKTEASMPQAEIVKLLTAHVTKMLGPDAAADMELQFFEDGVPVGAEMEVRFATKGSR